MRVERILDTGKEAQMSSAIRTRSASAIVMLVAAAAAVPAANANVQHGASARQAGPGAIVLERSGGYYDPMRSIYVSGGKVLDKPDSSAKRRVYISGGKVVDRSGGYYDPMRSIYVLGTSRAR
jgi:hypothetical protein